MYCRNQVTISKDKKKALKVAATGHEFLYGHLDLKPPIKMFAAAGTIKIIDSQ